MLKLKIMNKEEREIIKEAIEILRKNNEGRIARGIRKEKIKTTILFGIIPYAISYYLTLTQGTYVNSTQLVLYLFVSILALIPCTVMFCILFAIYTVTASPTTDSVLYRKRFDLWNLETKQSISYLSSVL